MKLFEKYDIEPIENHLVLQREVISDKTESGIITGMEPGKSNVATVLAAGPGLLNADGGRCPMQTKVGDVVVVDQFSGQEIVVEGDTLLVARESAIIAIIKKK